MASRSRRKKRPLPDWMGEAYDSKSKHQEGHDEPVADVARQGMQGQSSASTSVLSLCSSSASSSCTDTSVSDQQQPSQKKSRELSLSLIKGDGKGSASNVNPLSAEEIIRLSLPFLKFEGSIIYSFHGSDCAFLCEEIMSGLSPEDVMHIGFDMEWPVTYSAGATKKTALIQVCAKEDKCYLFHIAVMGTLPKALITLLSSSQIIKYGINIESDFWKLGRDFDIQVRDIVRDSVRDLGQLANAKLKSAERWNLDGLTRNVLRKRLNKDNSLRCGQWDKYPLSEVQLQYAATDAYASWLLANHLRNK